jgi:hypothetical protein
MKTSYIVKETFSGPIGLRDLWVEIKEVFEWEGLANLLHELNQVVLYLFVLLYQLGIDLEVPNWCSNQIKEDFRRFSIFKKWFKEHNLKYDLSYFSCGNNPKRANKVFEVLFRAGMPISYEYAHNLSNQV